MRYIGCVFDKKITTLFSIYTGRGDIKCSNNVARVLLIEM